MGLIKEDSCLRKIIYFVKKKHFFSLKPWLHHHRNWDEGTGGVGRRFGKKDEIGTFFKTARSA